MDSDECTPVAADVVLQKLFAGGLTDMCALCACATSLLRIDNTNYVHLNDVYNDRRLTLAQLVKTMQFDQFISKSSPQLICESCVRSMCRFQLYKNKCIKVTSGLKTLIHMVDNDLLEKVINVNTGEIATILPYKNINEFSDIDSGISTDDPEIIGFESIEEVGRVENTGKDLIVKCDGGYYKCALCPNVRLRANDLMQHRLLHYYKNVTHNLVLQKAFCFCCLDENAVMIDANSNMIGIESQEMVPLSKIMSALFSDAIVESLGRVKVCGRCFNKILDLYNFKKMSEASCTIVWDCVSCLEASLQSPKSALTITEENKHQNIGLVDLYSAFVELSVDRIRTVAPLLNNMKVYDEESIQRSIEQSVEPLPKKIAKNKYMCTICGIASETLLQARDHRLDHCTPRKPNRIVGGNSEPYVACHICGEEFVKPPDLHSHVTSKHNDLTFCPFCDKAYKKSRERILQSHMKTCERVNKPAKCDLCSASFVNKVKLSSHRIRHFPRDVKCDYCAIKFWTIRELKRHICKIHRELLGLQFECSMCPMEFGTKTERIEHAATHPPDSRHVCKFCFTTFRLKTNYVAHKCTGKILNLRNHERLLKRLKVERDGGSIEELIESDGDGDNIGMDSMCDLCGKMFKTERYLKAHRQTHLANAMDEFKSKKRVNEVRHLIKPSLVCDGCDYKTSYKNCLEAHINRYHLQIKPYACDYCTKKFYSKVNRAQHLKTHADGMPCAMCGNKFSSRKALRLHTRLHTGDRPYPCDLCGEKFISASRRQDHRIRKHFDPTVPCLDCMKYFYTHREYRMHVRDFHEGERKRRLRLKKQAQESNIIIGNEQ